MCNYSTLRRQCSHIMILIWNWIMIKRTRCNKDHLCKLGFMFIKLKQKTWVYMILLHVTSIYILQAHTVCSMKLYIEHIWLTVQPSTTILPRINNQYRTIKLKHYCSQNFSWLRAFYKCQTPLIHSEAQLWAERLDHVIKSINKGLVTVDL